MIKEIGNNILTMWQGDTGTIGFNIVGYEPGDKYLFAIKEKLEDKQPLYSQTFNTPEFTAIISEETSSKLTLDEYFWGIKLFRLDDDSKEIDTLIGKGTLKVKKGV